MLLPEAVAEALAARAIRAEQSLVTEVEEILSAAAKDIGLTIAPSLLQGADQVIE